MKLRVDISHLPIGLLASALLLSAAAPATGRDQDSAAVAQSTAQEAPSASHKVDWRAAAREDVIAAYETFSRHHPGMFDPNNPGFAKQLRRARDTALAFADEVRDAEGHMRALRLFSAGLADGHARVQAVYSGQGEILWPGFRTAWRGQALHVIEAGEDGPPRGAILLGCDGKKARASIRDVAFSFYGRPDEEGQWWINAPYFFERVSSPYETLPRECSFRDPAGRTTTYRLNWRPEPEQVFKRWFEAASRREPIGLTEPRRGIYLISLPTFSPDEEGRAAYARLFEELDSRPKRIAAGRAIVIDLRNNGGGSWSWSRDVAKRLWGEAAVTSALAAYFRNTQIWWLADPANVAHFRDLASRLRTEGRTKDAAEIADVATNLASSRKRGRRFYIEDYGAALAAKANSEPPRRLPPVYVIVDGGCASACLDALDLFTRFPGVKLVGAPTSADSEYMDIRFEPLPSGRGVVVLPTKIWVGRPRRPGEVYRPHIPVSDLEWTTATMLDQVERDLTHR